MRILIVTPLVPPEPGGPSYYSVALKEALERVGQKVTLKAFRDVRHLPSGVRHLVFFFSVFRLARKHDALIVLDTVSVALPAVLAAKVARRPVIIRTGGDFVWERYVERTGEKVLLSEFYEAVRSGRASLSRKERLIVFLQKNVVFPSTTKLAYSTVWQRDLWAMPYRIAREHTAIVENSCPPKASLGEDTVRKGDSERPYFLCAWRPTAFKNIDTLERAYELYHTRIGTSALALTLLTSVPRAEVYAKLAQARALVVPSLSEVSPNSVLEALAYGVPVIVTKDCGMSERFGDAVTYVDPRSTEAIAEALVALTDDVEYEKARGRAAAFAYVRTYDDIAKDFLVLCKDL